MNVSFTPWTDDEIAKLRQLWTDGLMTGDIAVRLGRTSKAVSAKAIALELAPRPRLQQPKHKQMPLVFGVTGPPKVPSLSLIELPRLPNEPHPVQPAVTLLNAKSQQCRWPVGKHDGEMRVCGHQIYQHRAWCKSHCQRAYVGGVP